MRISASVIMGTFESWNIDADTAPITVTNFVETLGYRKDFMTDFTFWRIIDGFMMHGVGIREEKWLPVRDPERLLRGEFST